MIMRYLKSLGLAVVAAAVLTAIIGASSASATVLCTETVTPCPAKKKIGPTGDSTDNWIHASLEPGTSVYFLSTTGTTAEPLATCTESTVKAEAENTGSATETVKGTIEAKNLIWGGCTPKGVTTIKGGTLEVHWIEGTDNGTVTIKEAEVTLILPGNVSCIYGAGAGIDVGTMTGGAMATLDFSAVINLVAGGFLCPKTVIWEAKYTVTEPEPLYVLKE
jgi:hypothetical protein